jgi:hypothetical protein
MSKRMQHDKKATRQKVPQSAACALARTTGACPHNTTSRNERASSCARAQNIAMREREASASDPSERIE